MHLYPGQCDSMSMSRMGKGGVYPVKHVMMHLYPGQCDSMSLSRSGEGVYNLLNLKNLKKKTKQKKSKKSGFVKTYRLK